MMTTDKTATSSHENGAPAALRKVEEWDAIDRRTLELSRRVEAFFASALTHPASSPRAQLRTLQSLMKTRKLRLRLVKSIAEAEAFANELGERCKTRCG
jgi:hypothetical protein